MKIHGSRLIATHEDPEPVRRASPRRACYRARSTTCLVSPLSCRRGTPPTRRLFPPRRHQRVADPRSGDRLTRPPRARRPLRPRARARARRADAVRRLDGQGPGRPPAACASAARSPRPASCSSRRCRGSPSGRSARCGRTRYAELVATAALAGLAPFAVPGVEAPPTPSSTSCTTRTCAAASPTGQPRRLAPADVDALWRRSGRPARRLAAPPGPLSSGARHRRDRRLREGEPSRRGRRRRRRAGAVPLRPRPAARPRVRGPRRAGRRARHLG